MLTKEYEVDRLSLSQCVQLWSLNEFDRLWSLELRNWYPKIYKVDQTPRPCLNEQLAPAQAPTLKSCFQRTVVS